MALPNLNHDKDNNKLIPWGQSKGMAYPNLTHGKDNTTMMPMYLTHDANVPKPCGQGKGMVTSPKLVIVLVLWYETFWYCMGCLVMGSLLTLMFSDWDVWWDV